jgi:cobalt/nickel transport system permease protein
MVAIHLDHITHTHTPSPTTARGFYRWDARVKVLCVVAAIILNTWLTLPWLNAATLTVGLILLAWTRIPARQSLPYLLVPLWSLLLVTVGMMVGFGVTPLLKLGPVTFYQEGLVRGGQIALRAYSDIVWIMGCVLTSTFPQICTALRWLRVPEVVVDTLAMMFRYAFLFLTEFRRMRLAALSRGGLSGYRAEMKLLGRISAQIFMRAFDRSERIYFAMVARGGERYE